MARTRPVALPPLLFGDEHAQIHTSAQAFAEMVDSVFPGVNAYEPMSSAGGVFRSKSAPIALNGVSIVNASVSPTYVDRFNNQVLTILLPNSGDPLCTAQVGRDRVTWGRKDGGVVLPITDERVTGTGGFRNQVMLQVDMKLLQQQAQSMLGPDAPLADLRCHHIRQLPLHYGKVSLLQGILHTLPLLRHHVGQPSLLNTLGVNNLLLRQTAILLRPDLFIDHERVSPEALASGKQKIVEQLCDYMFDHMAEPIGLADLEAVSGLCARTVQYAFLQERGCSPLAWLRNLRLTTAQQLLVGQPNLSIGQIAARCGFVNPSLFAVSYRKRFGLTPSEEKRAGSSAPDDTP